MSFQSALDVAVPALAAMKSRRKKPSASARSLERLAAARPPAARPSAAAAPSVVAEDPLPPAVDPSSIASLYDLRTAALACRRCPRLACSRTNVVFGVGNPRAELMFVGEAPGADEDEQGEPFVGRAGQLLTKIIAAMGLSRDDVYIGNVLKCRPDMPEGSTGNRKPRAEEMATCLPWLVRQIELIGPKCLVALGATALEGLTGSVEPMGKVRGRWLDFRGTPLMVTYHPAYLLRNQSISEKRKVWEDMLLVMEKLAMPVTERQRQFFTSASQQ